eukprot:PITA_09919
MAAVNKRQPPPGYPTGQNQKEEAPPVDNSIKTQEADGEDVDETDRGISARFRFGHPKPRSHERYPGPGLIPFDDYDPAPPRGRYNHPSGYDYPPPHGHARPGFQPHVSYEVSDSEDEVDYEGGYGHQAIRRPQQYYQRQTYVVDQPPPPPPPRRRPVYPPQGTYYVRDEYERY